eukprot:Gb_00747 [translate_table: standard]
MVAGEFCALEEVHRKHLKGSSSDVGRRNLVHIVRVLHSCRSSKKGWPSSMSLAIKNIFLYHISCCWRVELMSNARAAIWCQKCLSISCHQNTLAMSDDFDDIGVGATKLHGLAMWSMERGCLWQRIVVGIIPKLRQIIAPGCRSHKGLSHLRHYQSYRLCTSMEDGQQLSSRMANYLMIQTLYPVLRPTELATVAAGNPNRPVDGVNTIGILLTSAKVNTAAGYPSVSTEDEGRDPDYISIACLGTRQRFRKRLVVGLFNDLRRLYKQMYVLISRHWRIEGEIVKVCGCNALGSPRFGTALHLMKFMFSNGSACDELIHPLESIPTLNMVK